LVNWIKWTEETESKESRGVARREYVADIRAKVAASERTRARDKLRVVSGGKQH
jgi:hypothetical protein